MNETSKERFRRSYPYFLQFTPSGAKISWCNFGNAQLSEPFFHNTVSKLKCDEGFDRGTTSLEFVNKFKPEINICGFIFHVSRCGSTLLTNALRQSRGAVVISEAQPITSLLFPHSSNLWRCEPDQWERRRNDFIKGMVNAYAQKRIGNEKHLFIKFSSWNILFISTILSLWPDVPVLVIVRNPIEVLASCIDKPPGWFNFKSQATVAKDLFGLNRVDIQTLGSEEFAARVVGQFLKVADINVNNRCRIIDYQDIRHETISDVSNYFGIKYMRSEMARMQNVFNTYSKDATNKTLFLRDSEEKQRSATDAIRSAAETWSMAHYSNLLTNRRPYYVLKSKSKVYCSRAGRVCIGFTCK